MILPRNGRETVRLVDKRKSELRLTRRRVAVLLIILTVLFLAGISILTSIFSWDWTGFGSGVSQITITSASRGITTTRELQPGKTLWDWLGLLAALAVPVVVGFGVAWFTHSQQVRDQQIAEQRAESERLAAEQRAESERLAAEQRAVSEREIAADNQREEALQTYLDKISELLLKEHLRESQPEDEVQKIARIRTLTVLHRLDAVRKASVLQFLYEAGLITKGAENAIIDLTGANLSRADLSKRNLSRIKLNGANLTEADLTETDLSGADLHAATLSGADLTKANLSDVDLSKVDLRNARLEQTIMGNAILRGADLRRTNPPPSVRLSRCVSTLILWGDLIAADLTDADLTGAFLGGFDLSGACLRRTNLTEADLTEALLTNADLSGANLSKANLTGAKSNGANLSGANLSEAVLDRANLSKAIITTDQLTQARSLQGTTMPDGSKLP